MKFPKTYLTQTVVTFCDLRVETCLGLFLKVQGLKFTFRTPEMLSFESNTFVGHSEDRVKMVISAVGGEFAHRAPELKLPEKAALTQLEGVWTRFGKDLF